jgi:hypothetical protein
LVGRDPSVLDVPQSDVASSLAHARAAKANNGVPRRSLPYETLIPRRPIRNRKLTWVGAKDRPAKESIMLDVAFVALGCAVLALMGVYAHALRQL